MSEPVSTIRTFWSDRAKLDSANAARFYDAHTPIDQALIETLVRPGMRVLDLGCGTCIIANWLVSDMGATVHAVDSEAPFLTHAIDNPALTTEAALVDDYAPSARFDIVLLFGVINYLIDTAKREALYRRLGKSLRPGGALVIKSQFGIAGPVEVDTYSEKLGTTYYSLYPGLAAEVALLSNLFDVQVLDLYPPAFSPHANTHFRHLVARPDSAR